MTAQDQIDNLLVVVGEEIPGRFTAVDARLDALEVAVGALADAVREALA